MNVRLISVLLLIAPVLAAGCGAPKTRFADSERTEGLIPKARTAVSDAVNDAFGTPDDLVAWQLFPVDYGEIPGEVTGGSTDGSNRFAIALHADPEDETTVSADDLANLGLIWQSGKYQRAVIDSKSGEQPAHFQVLGYDSDAGELALNANLAEAVSPGDRFVLVGRKLQRGRMLYAEHCMHCHGVSGDGHGPTAKYLNPRPRDYRSGKFKFKSTRGENRPNRDDLERTIRYGLAGTYMPSFLLLEDDELDAIVEYIRWLAMRGEFEDKLAIEFASMQLTKEAYPQVAREAAEKYQDAMKQWQDELDSDPDFKPREENFFPDKALDLYLEESYQTVILEKAREVTKVWTDAENEAVVVVPSVPRPEPTPESIARGRELFLSGTTKCAECHGVTGRGDGSQTRSFQTNAVAFEGGVPPEPGLFDDWGYEIRPRDLTRSIYRGGRRPIDIFRRISIGIKGTPMPAFDTALKDEQIWDVVNYVMSLPYGDRNGTANSNEKRVAKR